MSCYLHFSHLKPNEIVKVASTRKGFQNGCFFRFFLHFSSKSLLGKSCLQLGTSNEAKIFINLLLGNLVLFKGTLISFYNTPSFFEEVNVGLIFWDNGTKTDFRQISAPDERNGDNSDDTEIGVIHKGLVFMA